MNDWVAFLRDDSVKKHYKSFKQELEDQRKEKQQIERKQRIGGIRGRFERVKALSKKITFTSPQ